jgi:hypothetical protein
MDIELDSEWQSKILELMKTLHGYDDPELNPNTGCVDFQKIGEDGKKILRLIINENFESAPIYVKTVDTALETLDETDTDELLLLGKRITSASRRIMREEEDMDYLTPKTSPHYLVSELAYAVQHKTMKLCKKKCGKIPRSEEDCKGFQDDEYNCVIRRISDDATFHAEMNWNSVLRKDFEYLVKIENQLIRE